MLGQLQDAAEVYETSMSIRLILLWMKRIVYLVLSLDSSLNDVKMRLAGIYEVLHEPRKALDLVYQGTSYEVR
jgi:general transcription factor 3C polypeptide 3 (transcription factor C subunit 4)